MSPAELREQCAAALQSTNLRAFLDVIRAGEGTSDPDGYRRHFGGRLFNGYADHPRVSIAAGGYTSTAAGAYQFLSRTWDECAKALQLPDFTPRSQDLAAVFLIRRRGALADAMAGRLDAAIAKCAREWASLPGSPYGQPTRTLEQAHATYAQAGGALAAAEPSQQEPSAMPIPSVVAALLPVLTSAVPDLVKLIRPDSKSAEQNAATAAKVFEIAQQAIGAANAQDVAERVSSDPRAAQAVRQAVQERWFELAEVGGGIVAAREADIAVQASGGILRSPSFWVALLLLPLVYLLVLSLIGMIGSATWSDDVRAGLAGSLISAIIGGLVGYYFGQTTTRNRSAAP